MSAFPSLAASAERLTCTGSADAATASRLRRSLKHWLQEVHGSAGLCDDVILSVNEALANCVEHAYRTYSGGGVMELHARLDTAAQSITVRVTDRGTWRRPALQRPNDPRASRGIALMHALADHCNIHADSRGTTVSMDFSTRSHA